MPRLTVEGLEQARQLARRSSKANLAGVRARLTIHLSTCGIAAGARQIMAAAGAELSRLRLSDVQVCGSSCAGLCSREPMATLEVRGQPPARYVDLTPEKMARIVREHVLGGTVVTECLLAYGHEREIEDALDVVSPVPASVPVVTRLPFFAKQQLLVLRNRGLIDPDSIDDYIAAGGYAGLAKALVAMGPEDIIREVTRSGLRGRGGAGFPTGLKWATCREAGLHRGLEPVVICNADEGDPGAFNDRSIIEGDPHAVIEGMAIAARAIGATQGFVYVRQEYPLARTRLLHSLEQARERGVLGRDILGTGTHFDIDVVQGAGAFVCGESTSLMASLEGRVGEPRAKYIHTVEHGYKDRPSNLNNVETFANVPPIVRHGGAWFGSIGTGNVSESPWNGSSGTKVFSLSGAVNNTGLIEVPMGISLREIVFEIGGGIPQGRRFKAVQTGGPSGGFLPESQLDLPVDFDSLKQAGTIMGSGGMVVADDRTCMVDAARYFVEFLTEESCGKCIPCREGLRTYLDLLTRITGGRGRPEDLSIIQEIGEVMNDCSLCALGMSAPTSVLSTIRYFRDEYEAHIEGRICPAGVCKNLLQTVV
jgi:NADH:ubiquinone oxidoreductase subunit F (NADH-binding)/(2Fe-2S) ferredoxin